MGIETKLDAKCWMGFIVQIIVYVVAIMIAFGGLDKRLTIVETKQEAKVDGERLERQLNIMKNEIIDEMKKELSDIKKENNSNNQKNWDRLNK